MIIYCDAKLLPTMDHLAKLYKLMKNGETLIIFFDIFEITILHQRLTTNKFKQLRLGEWVNTHKDLYFIACIKKSKPTFNSRYDNGIYEGNYSDFIGDLIFKHTYHNELVQFIF